MPVYLILLVCSIITLITLAVIFWRKRNVPGARPFSLLMISISIWSVGYYFEIQSSNILEFNFWANFQYIGIVLIPVTWLAFVARFTGRDKYLTKKNLLLLSIEPLIILSLVWSKNYHYLIWRDVQFEPAGFLQLGDYNYGPAFWFNAFYIYLLTLTGSVLLVQFLVRYKQAFRSQMVALMVGLLAPWICNLLYLTGFSPLPNFDLTLLGFTITGLAVSLALLRFRFLDILPVAHSSLIEHMVDGLLVLDERERIVEANPAAQGIFNLPVDKLLTLPVSLALAQFPDLVQNIHNIQEGMAEVTLNANGHQRRRIFEVRISPLKSETGRQGGKMTLLRDITERIESSQALQRREAILVAIRFAASELMKGSPWQDIIPGVLEQLGGVVEASRAYIFQNHIDADGELRTSKLYEWTAQGIQPQRENPDLQNLPVRQSGYSRWQTLMSQGQPVTGISEEFPSEERVLLERLGIRSILTMPVFSGENFWGFIGFDDCLAQRLWNNVEIDALKAAASTFGSSIQRQQMEEQLLDRLETLDGLYQTSLEIAAPHDLPRLLRTIVARAVKMIEGTSGGLYLRDSERDELVCKVSYRTRIDMTGQVLKLGEGAAGRVALTGKPLIIKDYRTWEGRASSFEQEKPFISVISAPMTWQDRVLGVIHVLHDQTPGWFSERDLTLLSLLANQAAIALQSAQTLQTMQMRARRLAIINDITFISLELEDQEQLLDRLTDRLGELMNADSCFIEMWDFHKEQVIPRAAFGPYKEEFVKKIFPPGEVSMAKAVLEAGKAAIAEDYQSSPLVSPIIARQFPRICSMIAVPLKAGEYWFGAALIGFHEIHAFSSEEIQLCEQAAAQVALAMDKTRLIAAAQHRAEILDALRANVTDLSGELDNQILLRAILERAVNLLNATGGDLGLSDPVDEHIEIVVSYNMGRDYTGTHMALGEGAMGLAVARDEIVVLADYRNWAGRSHQYTDGEWYAVMAVPLRSRGNILGALGIVDLNPERSFSSEDQELLVLFAQQASIAIENARLYNAQKQRARELGILYESSVSITKSLDLTTVCLNSAEQLCKAVNSTSAFILTCDLESGISQDRAEYFSQEANSLECVSEMDVVYNLFEYPRSIEFLRRGKPQVIRLSESEIDAKDREELLSHGVKSALEVPMIISGRVLGFADIWESREDRIWSDEEIRVCQTLANQAAIAIDNARLYSEILQIAVTDMLTGILNRRGLFEAGQRELNRIRRLRHPLSAVMLDIDHFKQVNDAFSHTAGDQVLKKLVKICQANLREIDIFGRYGGEEFVILLPETQYQKAYQVAERLRLRIARSSFETDHGPIHVTVSIGIASTTDGNIELATLLDRADSAMYSAKHKGRNRTATMQPAYDLHT